MRAFGLFGRKRPKEPKYKPHGSRVSRFTKCSFCGSGEFYEGPQGGAAMNVTCAGCGARFNIGLVPGGPVLLDTLSGPSKAIAGTKDG